jgi:hypothetical protein
MKTVIATALMYVVFNTCAMCQNAGHVPDKTKMTIFSSWEGKWTGEGTMQQGPGPAKKSTVEENIELKLDGMVLTVEGIGKMADGADRGKVVHHAFAVLYYDQVTQKYKFRSHLIDGRSTDAWFDVTGDNKYQWGFDVPAGKIRYTIIIDAASKKWNEIGEFSSDGNSWNKFFEMNLTKV